jgi:hypothetical protein
VGVFIAEEKNSLLETLILKKYLRLGNNVIAASQVSSQLLREALMCVSRETRGQISTSLLKLQPSPVL